ncbi:MAG: NAD-dependent epimerase/dehydratase family protein [Bellilinea sp.]
MSLRYLVTGTAGFIGARVTEFLTADGHAVVGIDNLNDAYDVRVKEYRLARLKQQPGFAFYRGDICDRPLLEKIGTEQGTINAVIHLAARAGVRASTENPWGVVDTNLVGSLNLLEFARQFNIPKFVLASTSSIYGAEPPLPTPEEADSSHPLQQYAASKKAAEALSHVYHHLYGLDVTIFRYFTVYGPAGRPDLALFRFVQWIAEGRPIRLNGDGSQSRGFTYVDDIARGTILGLRPLGYEIINLGGHESISMNDLIAMVEEILGNHAEIVHAPFHRADIMNNLADVSKARRLLGWEPQVGLTEGVRNLVNWYLSERTWTSQVLTE